MKIFTLCILLIFAVSVLAATENSWFYRSLSRKPFESGTNRVYKLSVRNKLSSSFQRRRSNRRHRHVYRFPDRDESSPLNCKANEYWLRCGPEKYCEKSCDNLNSPPNCHEELYHPKCYHPRCVCRKDFARNRDGFCVLKWNCPALIYNHDDTEIPQNRRIKQKRRRLY